MSSSANEAATSTAQLASQFRRWQGLRWVPPGAGALLVASTLLSSAVPGGVLSTVVIVVAVFVAVSDRWIDAYYQRVYGQVRDLSSRRRMSTVTRYVAAAVAIAAFVVDLIIQPPVLLSGVVVACVMVAFWLLSGGGRRAWPVLAVAPALVAFMPLTPILEPGRSALALLLAVIGVAEILGGAVDHTLLIHRIREIHNGIRK